MSIRNMMIGGAGASPPDAPTIGTATGGNASASVTFSAPANNGGSAITGFTVTSSPSGITGTGSSSPITVSGLSNGTAYTFTVTATNAIGTGAASSASNSVTPAVPLALYNIYMIGAGGGGNDSGDNFGGFGGFGHVSFALASSLSLSYVAGTGGCKATNRNFGNVGGQGRGGGLSPHGDGGGYTRLSGTGFDVICGGGGGAGYTDVGGNGGGPGNDGSTGYDWSCGGISDGNVNTNNNNAGKAGTSAGGGAAGTGGSGGGVGGSLQGGNSVSDGNYPGGGGGGGYFGGGSGGGNDGCGGGPGGGGSGFYSITNGNITSAVLEAASNPSFYNQNSGIPPYSTIYGRSLSSARANPSRSLTMRNNATYAAIITNGMGDTGPGNGTNAYHGVTQAGGHGEIVIVKNGVEFARFTAGTGSVTLTA